MVKENQLKYYSKMVDNLFIPLTITPHLGQRQPIWDIKHRPFHDMWGSCHFLIYSLSWSILSLVTSVIEAKWE